MLARGTGHSDFVSYLYSRSSVDKDKDATSSVGDNSTLIRHASDKDILQSHGRIGFARNDRSHGTLGRSGRSTTATAGAEVNALGEVDDGAG